MCKHKRDKGVKDNDQVSKMNNQEHGSIIF
jgi:hypothetical protein